MDGDDGQRREDDMGDDPRGELFCLLSKELTADQRRRAVLVAAEHAEDADDLRELLDMLGLSAADGRPRREGDGEAATSCQPPEWLAELAHLRRQLADPR
jgi:hypothetical protein